MTKSLAVAAVLTLALGALAAAPPPQKPGSKASAPAPEAVRAFLKANCVSCHNGQVKQGNLDLTALPFALSDAKAFAAWVTVHDRVRDGEMPPKGTSQPAAPERAAFLKAIAQPLVATDDARARREGRATWRRMNRYEYENTLRDLLDAPWLQVKEMLPEDGEAFRFNKVGDALDVSHIQMSRYLDAARYALREAMAQQATRPEPMKQRYYTREEPSFFRKVEFGPFNGSPERATFPIVGCAEADKPVLDQKAPMSVGAKDPARREEESLGVVASAYEPLEARWTRFRAPESGRYRLRLAAHTFWAGPESAQRWWRPSRYDVSVGRTREPVTLYAEVPPREVRRLVTVEVGPQAAVTEVDVYLNKGETIRPDAARLFRSRPPAWRNPLAKEDGQPGVTFRWLEAEGPIRAEWPGKGHRLLFGDLPLKADDQARVTVVPRDPEADAARLLRGFVRRAFRRPVRAGEAEPFIRLARTARQSGADFTEAMLAAYSAVLVSPAFVTLEERPGPLEDHALATRLSYFLSNSEPDAELRALADRGELRKPAVLRAQTERLLDSPKSQRFVDAFLDYWLDLRNINNTSPDGLLYPDYYLDDLLTESSVDETRAFFTELVRQNLPAGNVVASDFVMVNEKLADLYDIPGVQGPRIRRVAVPEDSPRGGLLTQASVLKVTANGTTTSPVVRGAWITERILGKPVPPPPAAVPAVEPDTRGATTIRQQLEKHRTDPTCRSCHARIDPPGFALEAFDVFGGWRDRYRATGEGGERPPGRGKNGQPFEFHPAQPVDATGTLPDGRRFEDVRALKRLLLTDERQIARNLVRQMVTYGTGAPVAFGDRPDVEAILDRAAPDRYGVRSLVHSVVASELFRSK